jgi:hypothetical protein
MSVAQEGSEVSMKKVAPTVLNLELVFNDKARTLRLMRALDADTNVSVNILKARLTPDMAWMELELRGHNPRLDEVAALLSEAASVKDPFWKPFSRAS